MTRFYLVRHADKEYPADKLAGRTPGVLLTQRGEEQAEAVGRFLAPAPISQVFSGPLERAQATAAAIARHFKLPVKISEAFDEINFGEWTNRSISSLEYDTEWNLFNASRSKTRVPSGESMLEVQTRFIKKIFELQATYPDAHIVIVSHAEPIRSAILYTMRASLDGWSGVEVSVGSVSILDVDQHHARLFYINHLVTAI